MSVKMHRPPEYFFPQKKKETPVGLLRNVPTVLQEWHINELIRQKIECAPPPPLLQGSKKLNLMMRPGSNSSAKMAVLSDKSWPLCQKKISRPQRLVFH